MLFTYSFLQQLLAGLVMGAHGAVGSTHNFMPLVFERMMENLKRGELQKAREEQMYVQKLCRVMYRYGKATDETCMFLSAWLVGSTSIHLPQRKFAFMLRRHYYPVNWRKITRLLLSIYGLCGWGRDLSSCHTSEGTPHLVAMYDKTDVLKESILMGSQQ